MAVMIIGAGVVGSQVARQLIEKGETPVLLDRAPQPKALAGIFDLAKAKVVQGDVLRLDSLAEAIRSHGVTEMIHLAANPMLTMGAQRNPYAAIELNIMGTANALEAARLHGVKRVVVASSGVLSHNIAGGAGKGNPMHEEAFPRPTTFYASCKQAVENLGLNYARWCGVEFAAMRYAAVAGPWDGEGGGVPSNDFLAMVRAALAGEEVVITSADFEWVYSKDAARATLLALRAPLAENHVFNVGMGRTMHPEDLGEALSAAVPGARYRIERLAAGSPLQNQVGTCDMSVSRKVLGFEPQYQMADAVRDTVEWFRSRRG